MTMIFLDDSPWSRSYSVWSQLAVELPALMGGGPVSAGSGLDTKLDDLRAEDRADHAAAVRPRPDLA